MRKPQTTCALLQVVRHCTERSTWCLPRGTGCRAQATWFLPFWALSSQSHKATHHALYFFSHCLWQFFTLFWVTVVFSLAVRFFYLKLFSRGSFLPMITNKRVWEQGSTQRLTCSVSSSSDPCQALRMAFSLQFLEGELVLHTDGLSDRQMAAASNGVF